MDVELRDLKDFNLVLGLVGLLILLPPAFFIEGTEVACIDHQPSYSFSGFDGSQIEWTDGCNDFSTSWIPIVVGGLMILFASREHVENIYTKIRGG